MRVLGILVSLLVLANAVLIGLDIAQADVSGQQAPDATISLTAGTAYAVDGNNPLPVARQCRRGEVLDKQLYPQWVWRETGANWKRYHLRSGVFWNGLHLEVSDGKLYLVGTPHRASTNEARVYYREECKRSGRPGTAQYLLVAIAVTGSSTFDTESIWFGHHHAGPDLSGYALSGHSHPAPDLSGYVARSLYDALLARVVAAEHANTCRNLGGVYDTSWTRGVSTRALPTTHCCKDPEGGVVHTLEQCERANEPTPQQSQATPPIAPPAPSGGAPEPELR